MADTQVLVHGARHTGAGLDAVAAHLRTADLFRTGSLFSKHMNLIRAFLTFSSLALVALLGHAQVRPERGKITYEGTYSGRAAEGFLFLAGTDIEGAITVTVDFDGPAVRATYRTTGKLPGGAVSGQLSGDLCKLEGRRNLKIEGECTSTEFKATLVSQPVPERKTTVKFNLKARIDPTETRRVSVSPEAAHQPAEADSGSPSMDATKVESAPNARLSRPVDPTSEPNKDIGPNRQSSGESSAETAGTAIGIDVLRIGMTIAQVDAAVAGTGLERMESADSSRIYSLIDDATKNEIQVDVRFRNGQLEDVSFSVLGTEREPGAQDALWRSRMAALYGRYTTRVVGAGGSGTYCHGSRIGVSMPADPPRKGAFLSYLSAQYESVRKCRGAKSTPKFDAVAYSQRPIAEGNMVAASSYSKGAGDPPHPREAAARAGDAEAQWEVGSAYVHSKLHPERKRMGVQLLESAAAKGNAKAMNKLGQFHSVIASPPDFDSALNWFMKADAAGHPFAAINIGLLYEGGLGVKKNDETALRWYLKLANAGSPDAAAKVVSLVPDYYTRIFDAIPEKIMRDAEDLKFSKGSNLRDYLDALIYFQAEDWRVNKYDRGTLRNVQITAGDANGATFTVRANYSFTGGGSKHTDPTSYYVDVTLANGEVECIRYGDNMNQCLVISKIFIQPQTTQAQRQACLQQVRTPRYVTKSEVSGCQHEGRSMGPGLEAPCLEFATRDSEEYIGDNVEFTNSCSYKIVVGPQKKQMGVRSSELRQTLAPGATVKLFDPPPMRVH